MDNKLTISEIHRACTGTLRQRGGNRGFIYRFSMPAKTCSLSPLPPTPLL